MPDWFLSLSWLPVPFGKRATLPVLAVACGVLFAVLALAFSALPVWLAAAVNGLIAAIVFAVILQRRHDEESAGASVNPLGSRGARPAAI